MPFHTDVSPTERSRLPNADPSIPRSCSHRTARGWPPKRSSYILRTTFKRKSSSSASLALVPRVCHAARRQASRKSKPARPPPTPPAASRRSRQTHCRMRNRVPGSSIMQATDPAGICVQDRSYRLIQMRHQVHRSAHWRKIIDVRSFSGMGFNGTKVTRHPRV